MGPFRSACQLPTLSLSLPLPRTPPSHLLLSRFSFLSYFPTPTPTCASPTASPRRDAVTPRPCRVRPRTTITTTTHALGLCAVTHRRVDRPRHSCQRVRSGMEIRRCCVTEQTSVWQGGRKRRRLTLAHHHHPSTNYPNIYARPSLPIDPSESRSNTAVLFCPTFVLVSRDKIAEGMEIDDDATRSFSLLHSFHQSCFRFEKEISHSGF